MHSVTIYHNPKCGSSRNTLALIRFLGIEPTVIHYLDTPPDEATLRDLIAQMGVSVRHIIRTNPPYEEMGLANPALSDDELIAAILKEPILMNRPIVVTEKGVRLCRPVETFLEITPVPLTQDFIKENGDVIKAT